MKRMIFHIPMKIDRNRASASQIRPMRMIEAFKECGYEVAVIEGEGKERKRQIKEIKSNILKGVKYDFLYSESSTMPTLLTEKNHLPLYPFLDFSFFAFCKKHGIKIGLFYRDIFWCYYETTSFKQWIAKIFYRYDVFKYNRLIDTLFLPSKEMLCHIPNISIDKIAELPSGLDDVTVGQNSEHQGKFTILYVGGIGDFTNIYNLKLFMEVVSDMSEINFVLCCRERDWKNCRHEYEQYLGNNVQVVHHSGSDIKKLYERADLFCMFFEPSGYWEFAVPFKFFEAVGYHCPLLSVNDLLIGKYIIENNLGFTCAYDKQSLKNLLGRVLQERDKTQAIVEHVSMFAKMNTWKKRCQFVSNILNAD